MNQTEVRPAEQIVAAAAVLGPAIAARSGEIERLRRVPLDLLDQLVAAGCLAMFRPPSHGGTGVDLPTGLRVVETLAAADASVGWIVMIGSTAWCDLVGLPRVTFDELFDARNPGIVSGVFNPTGTITAAGDHYRVTGRWSFASGCEHASWIYGNCIEDVVDGVPSLRIAVFSPDQIVIEDTWDVVGLSGTGSHHFHVDAAQVPREWTCVPMSDEPCLDHPIVRVPIPALIAVGIGSVAIGIARGALNDIVTLAERKVPLLAHGALATSPVFQMDLARAETELRACRSLLHDAAESLWGIAVSGSPCTLRDRAEARAAAVWTVERAVSVVDTAYRCGGGGSLYNESPMQRRLRDIHALTQHFLVRSDTMTLCGAVLAGQDVDVPVF